MSQDDYLNRYTQCQIMLFDVMIDRLHDVALTVGTSVHFTWAVVKLVVQYGMCCGSRPGKGTGIFAVGIPAMGLAFLRLASRQWDWYFCG